jgi:hypothetical protein
MGLSLRLVLGKVKQCTNETISSVYAYFGRLAVSIAICAYFLHVAVLALEKKKWYTNKHSNTSCILELLAIQRFDCPRREMAGKYSWQRSL